MKLGRPTKYHDGMIQLTEDYIQDYRKHGDVMPSIAGLACILGVRRETIHEWAKQEEKQIFSNMLGQLLATQERVLFNNGLTGDFNATIAKLALAKHGHHDKQDTSVSGPGGGAVQSSVKIEFIDSTTPGAE